jgi:hypothetical protein
MRVADLYLADKLAPEQPRATPVARIPVKIDPAVYDAYVGRYLVEGRGVVKLFMEDGRLMGQPDGQSKGELVPQSDTKFFIKQINAEATFERDEKGKVVRFTIVGPNEKQTARRLDSPPATAAQLAEFAGDYYSPELGTTYTMLVKDGRLTVQHRRHDDMQLTELDGDSFVGPEWFFQRVQFTRNSEKRIDGFRLTSGRVRNVRFDKQAR